MPDRPEPKLADAAAQEANQAIGDLERALEFVDKEDSVKAALQIGIAIGRLQSFVERRLGEKRS